MHENAVWETIQISFKSKENKNNWSALSKYKKKRPSCLAVERIPPHQNQSYSQTVRPNIHTNRKKESKGVEEVKKS